MSLQIGGGGPGYPPNRPGTGPGYGGYQLRSDDQKRFDSYYSRWLDYQRTNNQSEVRSMEKRMYDIYSSYRIPNNVPFARVASPNVAQPGPAILANRVGTTICGSSRQGMAQEEALAM